MTTQKKPLFLALTLVALFSLAFSVSAETGSGKTRVTPDSSDDLDVEIERIYLKEVNDIDADFEEIDSLDDSFKDLDRELSSFERKLDGNDDIDESDDSERSRGDEHKSEIADIMKELEKIADRDYRIGDDIDEVVKEQKDLEEKTAKALDEVEKRDGLRTFFFGADYKNLGELKSTIETTENHIDRLEKALGRTTDAMVKAGLEAQIRALEETASSTEAFVRDNEDVFSLFGWFVKIFRE